MIFIGLGANLPTERFGPPRAALGAALHMLAEEGVRTVRRSPWYESAPVPMSDDPWYVNGVAEIETEFPPLRLVGKLLEIEARVGRVRSIANAPRVLDLDLIAYNQQVLSDVADDGTRAIVPHPRMTDRAFVLFPLSDLSPGWQHPQNHIPMQQMIASLPDGQMTRLLPDANGYKGTEWQVRT